MSLPWQLALGDDTPTTVSTAAGRISAVGPQFLNISVGSAGQVLMTDGAAHLSWGNAGTSGGPGGSPPGGSLGQLQINAGAGNFGGLTMSGDATLNYSTGALTLRNANAGGNTIQGITFDQQGRITAAVNQSYLQTNQTITLGTDLSGSGTTTLPATIVAGAVTLPKMENRSASILIGRGSTGAGIPQEITLGANLTMTGTVLAATSGGTGLSGMTAGQIPIPNSATTINASGNLSGDVTTSNSLVTTIGATRVQTGMLANNAVTYGKMQTVGAVSLLGNSTGATAAAQEVTLGARLGFTGTVLNVTAAGATGNVQYNNANALSASTGLTLSATTLTGVAINLSGSDATGDIYYRNASGNLNRLAIGTANQVLAVSAGLIPNWVPASGGGVSGSGLTNNAVIVGTGGTGIAALGTVGGTNTVLHGNTGAAPTWSAVAVADISATGTASSSTYLRGDGQWFTPPGGGSGTVNAGTANQLAFYATSTNAVSGNTHLTETGTETFISYNATALGVSPGIAGETLQVVGASTGAANNITSVAIGGNPSLNFLRTNTAAGSGPTNTQIIGRVSAGGFGATLWKVNFASLTFTATEPWDDTHAGSQAQIITTENGGGVTHAQATFGGIVPGVTVGAPTAQASPTYGDLNAVRMFQNGVQLQPGFAESVAWTGAVNPNNVIIYQNKSGRTQTVVRIDGYVETTGTATTIHVKSQSAGTALSSGTTITGTALNLSTAGAVPMYTAGTATLNDGDRLGVYTTSTTFDTGVATITVSLRG